MLSPTLTWSYTENSVELFQEFRWEGLGVKALLCKFGVAGVDQRHLWLLKIINSVVISCVFFLHFTNSCHFGSTHWLLDDKTFEKPLRWKCDNDKEILIPPFVCRVASECRHFANKVLSNKRGSSSKTPKRSETEVHSRWRLQLARTVGRISSVLQLPVS